MNKRLICKFIGLILIIEAALLLLPMGVAFIYGEKDWIWFVITLAGSAAVGIPMYLVKTSTKNLHASDGFLIVALAWIVLSAVAAVPFVISGSIPNYLNAIFETVSGFTTSGVTIMDDVEILSYSMQFWRIFTHWIGGMGILVFMLAISPVAGGGTAIHVLRAESPGPVVEKVSPKIATTARYLYLIYIGLTLAEVASLMISGLDMYHSFLIGFGTMATGGFSYLNASMATVTFAQQTIITVFMLLAGINFSLYFLLLTGRFKSVFKNEELRWYLAIYVGLCVILSFAVCINHNFDSVGDAIHHVAFMSASLMTTTGYASCDVNVWPWFAKHLVLFFMFFGASSGSTAGGIKLVRIGIGLKSIKNSLHSLMHPRSVSTVRYNGKEVQSEVIRGVHFYLLLFVVIFVFSMIVVCLDPKGDFTSAFSAVDTTINNNGIAIEGAAGSMSGFAWYSKIVFIIDMLIGRLEIFPIMVLFGTIIMPVKIARRRLFKSLLRRN